MNIFASSLKPFFVALVFLSAVTTAFAANFNVTNLNDSGNGSFRAAILTANTTTGADTISFQTGLTGTINLISQLSLTDSVIINGPGARVLTVSGNNVSRVFNVSAPGTSFSVSINGLTVAQGYLSSGYGGGIYNGLGKTLNLTEVAVTNCAAPYGGGIYNDGTLNVTRSTVGPLNTATVSGGGVYNDVGTASITGSTISDNTAGTGGGITNAAQLVLDNVTISNNSSENSRGGGIYNSGGETSLRNTIVAGNFARSSGADLNGSFNTLGNNLIGENTDSNLEVSFPHGAPQENGDKIGTSGAALDPMLGELDDNGGSTDTLALLPMSPAVDAGNNCVAAGSCSANNLTAPSIPATDQRGFIRQADGSTPRDGSAIVDIGAFEFAAIAPTAASVWVEGRVTNGKRGINLARVYLTNQFGEVRIALTNPSGYYRFEDVQVGETYVFKVFSKQYRFSPQVITVNQEMTELNFASEQ